MLRLLAILLSMAALAGCAGSGNPFDSDIGGDVVVDPPIENFRGPPVVRLTFITTIDPAAEFAFLIDYIEVDLDESASDDPYIPPAIPPDYQTARTNLDGMIAKNVFYAMHLAKYLKLRSDGDFTVILNPVTLKHEIGRGYYYQSFEEKMPPADIDLNFLAYVHPRTRPSTRGEVLTSYGESLAPVVSIRMDTAFNPELDGAIALTDVVMPSAHNPDDRGARAQLIDHINVRKFGKTGTDYTERAVPSGPFQPGMLFELDMETFTLEEDPPEEEILSEEALKLAGYKPGSYYAYEFYEGYYRIIMSALQSIDNRLLATVAQKNYWAYYESPDKLEPVMLERLDRRKHRFLLKVKRAELDFLQDRDDNWMHAVLETNDFQESFNKLRDAEQQARDDYINAQINAALGVFLGVLGAVAAGYSAGQDSYAGVAAGGALVGLGLSMFRKSVAELDSIDVTFAASFESAYASQKAYVFDTAEGERIKVRAATYNEFKENLKSRYDQRFKPKEPAATS